MVPLTNVLVAAITLALPGPTNALLAVAGSTLGVRASCRLVPAVLAGYACAMGSVAVMAAPLIGAAPVFVVVLRVLAAAVLLLCAQRLWRLGAFKQDMALRTETPVSSWHAFATTLLNPKALVLSALFLPEGAASLSLPWSVGVLPILIFISALGWIAVGAGVRLTLPASPAGGWTARAGAIVLLVFALAFASSALM